VIETLLHAMGLKLSPLQASSRQMEGATNTYLSNCMTKSYVVGLLQHLHAFGETSPGDLWLMLDKTRGRFLSHPMEPEDGIKMVERVLADLANLGVVQKGNVGWLLAGRSPSAASDGTSIFVGGQATVPPRRPPADGDGDGGNGQGGSLGEVLRHPVLFAVDRDDFEDAVNRALIVIG